MNEIQNLKDAIDQIKSTAVQADKKSKEIRKSIDSTLKREEL